ncbi:MAG: hypothetical protein WC841_04795 [Candidatus Shapirobacteria bacterium]
MKPTKEDIKNPLPAVPVKTALPPPPKAPNVFKPNFSNFNKNVRSASFMSNNRGRR